MQNHQWTGECDPQQQVVLNISIILALGLTSIHLYSLVQGGAWTLQDQSSMFECNIENITSDACFSIVRVVGYLQNNQRLPNYLV